MRLYRVNGSTRTDISPTDGSGYAFGNTLDSAHGVRTYDSDRRYVVLVGITLQGGSHYCAAFVSSDHGDTWTQIVDTVLITSTGPRGAIFAADTPNIIYLWGFNGYISYSYDQGLTVDDRRGNIPTDFASAGDFIGIAGG